ncbi:MAG: uroporphyrinogen-III synthase [Planctomycetota bacterium]|nr:uroporphyrinogen-III synthase [Planctomycetota bacterium]
MNEEVLQDRTIVVTRPESRSAELSSRLEEFGAKVFRVPSIRFSRPADTGPWKETIARKDDFSHVIFTSRVAADSFEALCSEAGFPAASWLSNCTVAAIGAATGERLKEVGIVPSLVAGTSSGAGFARELIEKELLGEDSLVLLPGSNIARPELSAALKEAGARVTSIPIYQTLEEDPARAEELFEALDRDEQPDAVTFASPSALSGFLGICGTRGRKLLESPSVKIVSLGPTTSAAVRSEGLEVSAQAASPGTESLVAAVREALD